jgi:hypothetical protein
MKTLFTLIAALALCTAASAITIDGQNITGDFANAPWVVYQDVQDDWGGNQVIALYIDTNDTHLLVGFPSRVNNNALVFLIDGNPATGSNAVPSGLQNPERVKGMAGLQWDTNFTPDRAVSLGVNDGGTEGYPHFENIVADQTHYMGLLSGPATTGGVVTNDTSDTIIGAFMPFTYDISETNTAAEGVEIAIDYNDLANVSPTVRVMVMVCGMNGDWANNNCIPPAGGNSNWVSSVSADHDAAAVPGEQFLTIIVPVADTGVQFFVSATKNKGIAMAQSSAIDFSATASAGTPPYFFNWDLGNGAVTGVQNFTYYYPADGDFTTTAIVSDSGGNSVTVDVGSTKVYEATTADGLTIPADFAGMGGTSTVQDTPASSYGRATAPGNGSQLDQLFAYSMGRRLHFGICGNLTTGIGERTIGLFIDSDYTVGSNVMPGVSVGSPNKLGNLSNMTFDTGFSPDKALLVSVNTPGDFYVNVYHINSNSEWYWDTKTEFDSIFDPFQRVVNDRGGEAGDVVAINDSNTAATPSDATMGIEGYLDLDTINEGFVTPPTQTTIRLQAILYNWQMTNVANQSLPGIGGNAAGQGNAMEVDYSVVPGQQYIEIGAPVPEPAAIAALALAIAAVVRARGSGFRR